MISFWLFLWLKSLALILNDIALGWPSAAHSDTELLENFGRKIYKLNTILIELPCETYLFVC